MTDLDYAQHLTPTTNLPVATVTKDNFEQYGTKAYLQQVKDGLDPKGRMPTCEVHLNNVSYVALASANKAQKARRSSVDESKPHKYLLKNFNAVLKPGSMTLILGPPGSGKSTLLKLIAGLIKPQANEILSGSISYNGAEAKDSNLAKLAAYVSQTDTHLPTLTVRETIEFAHKCSKGNVNDADPLARMEKDRVDILLKLLGLRECADTIIGNESLRRISGGQKKRVTFAEMVVGQASLIAADEFSTGLDTSATIDIVKLAREVMNTLDKTFICSMLQPPPEAVALFDQVIVMDQGQLMYCGPLAELRPYFHQVGYTCSPSKDIADFCQEVTTDIGSMYRNDIVADAQAPSTPSEFADCFARSELNQRILQQQPFNASGFEMSSRLESVLTNRYTLSLAESLKEVFKRQFKVVMRDTEFNRVRIVQNIFSGLMVGSLFYNLGDGQQTVPLKYGMLFMGLLMTALTTLSNVPVSVQMRNVMYKQRLAHFYPPLAYAISESAMEVFWSFIQTLVLAVPLYWLVGLSSAASGMHFFIYYILLVCNSIVYAQLFKLVAAVSPDEVIAQILGGFSMFLTQVLNGFTITKASIPQGWEWFYWINPASWAFRAFAQNEFLSSDYDALVPVSQGPPVREGDLYLQSFSISTEKTYIVGGILYMLGFYVVLLLLTTAAYRFLHFDTTVKRKLPKKTPSDENKSSESYALDISSDHEKSALTEFTPVTLAFKNLVYSVPIKHAKTPDAPAYIEQRKLLNGIHGSFRPGTLTALMGSSGAGKTTLLDVLASRKTTGTIEGEIFVNGYAKEKKSFGKVSGYVEQTDTHCATSTVYESLMFSAALRLPSTTTTQDHVTMVNNTMDTLGLQEHRSRYVSDLSPEQLKRLTIGVELVANPSVLFLDEPTSGLDARAAYTVVSTLQKIKATGRTIICTIHQPNATLFEMFDNLLLLQTGGHMVYFGPLGEKSQHLLNYFYSIDGIEPPSNTQAMNPATFMLECIGAGTMSKNEIDFPWIYNSGTLAASNLAAIEGMQSSSSVKLDFENTSKVSTWVHLSLNLRRAFNVLSRTTSYSLGRLVVSILVTMVFGSIFNASELTSTENVQSQLTTMFMAMVYMGVVNIVIGLPVIMELRKVFYREQAIHMYPASSFVVAIGISELPFVVMNAVVFVNIFYWWMGLNGAASSFLWFGGMYAMYTLLMVYISHLLCFVFPDAQTATVVMGLFISTIVNFSGFFLPVAKMPIGWKFMYWLSPLHYAFEAIATSQFFSNMASVVNVFDPSTTTTIAAYVESYFGGSFSEDHQYYDVIGLATWILIVLVLTHVAANFINHVKR